MKIYTLHLPRDLRPGDTAGLDRAQLVPDGFSWTAFAFSAAWFLFHRLWLAALLVVVGLVALAAAGYAIGLSPVAASLASLLASVLIGLEASSLRRWTLSRRGSPVRDVVLAGNREEAEAKAFSRWLEGAQRPVQPVPVRRETPVIGLFPFNEERA